MNGVGLDSSAVILSNNVDVIKKAMDVQARDVMSILNSSNANANLQTDAQKQSQVAATTGVGQNIDIKI